MGVVLVYGRLFRAPERRTSRSGKMFTVAKLREGAGDGVIWWSILAFDDLGDELASLADGDALAACGALKVAVYERNGEPQLSFSMTVDRLIALRQKKRDRKGGAGKQPHEPQSASAPPDDDMPF